MIPGEAFPTRYRSTSHGISAASGKLGAIVAQVGFARLKDIGGTNKFVKVSSRSLAPPSRFRPLDHHRLTSSPSFSIFQHILELFALFMLSGIGSTLLLPETMGRSLEDISGEDQENFVQMTDAQRQRAREQENRMAPKPSGLVGI